MMVGEWLSERQRLEHNEQSRNNRKNVNGTSWLYGWNVRINLRNPHARCLLRHFDYGWWYCVNVWGTTTMSYVWCHGPKCHTYATQDRVRGSKGSKVLRTRKVKQNTQYEWYDPNSIYNYFCSQTCIFNFWNANAQRVIALAPRTEPLETRIEDPKKTEHSHEYSSGNVHKWTTTEIKKVDTVME